MPTRQIPIQNLKLDRDNFRHPHAESEIEIVNLLNTANGALYHGLLKSFMAEGYLPTENILVIDVGGGSYKVAEGNRRVSLLKLIHGLIDVHSTSLTQAMKADVENVPESLKRETDTISCTVYTVSETEKVNKIVARIHAKGSNAARCQWDTIGKARQNRSTGGAEPALDLLEQVIASDRTITEDERYYWPLNYPLTILQDALSKIAGALGLASVEVVAAASGANYGAALVAVVLGIGRKTIHFAEVRAPGFLCDYGFRAHQGGAANVVTQGNGQAPQNTFSGQVPTEGTVATGGRPRVQSIHVKLRKCLREIYVYGGGREKIKKLINEMVVLDAEKTPLIFAYSLRSLIDISAHVYAEENNIPVTHPSGSHGQVAGNPLSSVVTAVKNHIVANRPNWAGRAAKESLENALRRCTQTNQSFLSISDLNDLVHDRSSIVTAQLLESEVPMIIPLIKAMNNG